MFKNWDWEDTWQIVGVVLTLVLAAITLFAVVAPKNVDYYYLSNASRNGSASCVYAHWTWHWDEAAYCSDNKDSVLDFAIRANQSLARKVN